MQTEILEYPLPRELIAQKPLEERDAARLLCINRLNQTFHHSRVRQLPELLDPSLIVVNDTKVIPARIFGKKASGGRVEFLLLERLSGSGCHQRWLTLLRTSTTIKPGICISCADSELSVQIDRRQEKGVWEVSLFASEPIELVLQRCGNIPLPPYIQRDPDQQDAERYQTIYAKTPGAVAAPTAGLHLSERLITELEAKGHEFAYLTLHVGPGTFTPVRRESLRQHEMHSERFSIPQTTYEAVQRAKKEMRQVLAVGTTVVRALESAFKPQSGRTTDMQSTSLFIYPPYRFQVVDALLTNFHLPRSTLLALVMAFAGVELIQSCYATAVKEQYRFFSYGDAMLIQGAIQDSG